MNKLTLRARLWILALVPVLGVIGTSVFSMYSANSVYSDLLERIHKEAFVAQSLVITYIVVEVCLVATALALIINVTRHTKSLDVRKLTRLKG